VECSQNGRRKSGEYHMSLDEIRQFLFFTKKSGYIFNNLTFGGAEPLLWKNLEEAINLIKKASFIKEISLISNGLLLNRRNMDKLNDIDQILISKYKINEKHINNFLSKYHKIKVLENEWHYKKPFYVIKGAVPGVCTCPNLIALHKQKIYWCSAICSLMTELMLDETVYPDLALELKRNYLNGMFRGDYGSHKFCGACIFNENVRKLTEKIAAGSQGPTHY